MIDHLVETDSAGVHLHRICHGAGLGGTPYRDGTFKYYVEEKVVSDVMMGWRHSCLPAWNLKSWCICGNNRQR